MASGVRSQYTRYDGPEEGIVEAYYWLDVAWSLTSSLCRDGGPEHPERVSLADCARDLDLEAFSKEPGMAFSEHVRYEAGTGECLANETCDYNEYWWDPDEYATWDEFKDAYGIPDDVDPGDWEPDNWVGVGGFEAAPSISVQKWIKNHQVRNVELEQEEVER